MNDQVDVRVYEPAKRGRAPGFTGTVNRKIPYTCDDCGRDVGRAELNVKKVVFTKIGRPIIHVRTRAVKWVCGNCMEKDPDYNREANLAAPGFRDVRDAKLQVRPTERVETSQSGLDSGNGGDVTEIVVQDIPAPEGLL